MLKYIEILPEELPLTFVVLWRPWRRPRVRREGKPREVLAEVPVLNGWKKSSNQFSFKQELHSRLALVAKKTDYVQLFHTINYVDSLWIYLYYEKHNCFWKTKDNYYFRLSLIKTHDREDKMFKTSVKKHVTIKSLFYCKTTILV